MTRLAPLFAAAQLENRALLIGYLPAGFPTVKGASAMIAAMVEGGVDLVEVGLPYSDPIMDGPVIQRASEIAIQNGFHIPDVFATVGNSPAPSLVMSYWNPIARYGVSKFAAELAAAGGVGLITPDLTIEESREWRAAAVENSLAQIYVVAPSTTNERLAAVSSNCSGFIYAASLMGVTGARTEISRGASDLVARLRERSQLPICVGLGISTREQAHEVAQYADGVIVGSAFIKEILAAPDETTGRDRVRKLARELAAGVKRG